MSKVSIANHLSKKLMITERESCKIISDVIDSIADVLQEEGRVEIRKFGSFQVRQSSERMCRNPKTGDPAVSPARKRAWFRPSRLLTETLNDESQTTVAPNS
jgi:nucleoid DNA-binding protein